MTPDDLVRRHRSAFAPFAGDYQRARPGYPVEAVAWMLGEGRLRILDLGAGTGKLTDALIAAGQDGYAADLLLGMARELHARLPEVPISVAQAEHLPFAANSFDAVVCGQAFHWFDFQPSLDEIARVLTSHGRLGLIWNLRDERVDWVKRMSEVIGSERLGGDWSDAIDAHPAFGPLEHTEVSYEQELDIDTFLSLVRSRSYVATLDETGRAKVLADLEDLWRTHPDLAGAETFTLPYRTVAYRTERTG